MSKKGREQVYELSPEPLQSAEEWMKMLEMEWDQRLQALKQFLAENP